MTSQMERQRPHDPGNQPAIRRIQQDLNVNGLLRLGDDCIFEGDIAADGGVVLGNNTIVKGDIITRGPVMLGAGSRVEGRINPSVASTNEEAPDPEDVFEQDREGPSEREDTLALSTVETTLDLLLGTAIKAASEGAVRDDGHWWNLETEAADDIARGVLELLDGHFRDGDGRDWTPEEVLDILVTRALPLAIPMTVKRDGPTAATIRIDAPRQAAITGHESWGPAVLSLISLVGTNANPAFEVRELSGIAAIGPQATKHLHARIRVA